MTSRAVFFDRDGVVIHNRADYVKTWDEVRFLPGGPEALGQLHSAGFLCIQVTNQSSAGRSILTLEDVLGLNQRITDELIQNGGWVDGSYLCPHAPDAGCECRKPRPGMLLQAAREFDIDLENSFMVGDAVTDLQAAQSAGVSQRILVLTGRGDDQRKRLKNYPGLATVIVDDIQSAANFIVENVTNNDYLKNSVTD